MKIDVILEAGLEEAQVEQLAVQAERYGIQTLWVASFPSRRVAGSSVVLTDASRPRPAPRARAAAAAAW